MARRLAFEDGGRQLGIEYRPELFADPDFRALVERVRVTNDWGLSARVLARILVAWTLTARGRPIPITEAAILELPRSLHVAIVRAIAADRERLRRAGFVRNHELRRQKLQAANRKKRRAARRGGRD